MMDESPRDWRLRLRGRAGAAYFFSRDDCLIIKECRTLGEGSGMPR
jgi:hypothetical protein